MIDASELRIGNKFRRVGGTMIQTVFEIIDNTDRNKITFQTPGHKAKYHKLITCEENLNQYKPIEIEGIPLTPELLERLGFKQNENSDNWWNKEADCSIDVEPNVQPNAIELLFYYVLSPVRRKHIMYVHQLQNLYFALTGTELILNPKP